MNLYLKIQDRPTFELFLSTQSDLLSKYRMLLVTLLKKFPSYASTLSKLIFDPNNNNSDLLYLEHAAIYSIQRDINNYLNVVVHKLHDYKSAELFCISNSGNDKEPSRKNEYLFILLQYYMSSNAIEIDWYAINLAYLSDFMN